MLPKKVLVVDDEPAIRALVSKIVERAGFIVDSARDGLDAIRKIDENEYAVILIDLMMPNVDGYGVIDHLRKHGGPRPAVIVLTAADSAQIRQLDGRLVHSVVRKPFDIDVISDLVSAAAEQSNPSDTGDLNIVPFPRRGMGK